MADSKRNLKTDSASGTPGAVHQKTNDSDEATTIEPGLIAVRRGRRTIWKLRVTARNRLGKRHELKATVTSSERAAKVKLGELKAAAEGLRGMSREADSTPRSRRTFSRLAELFAERRLVAARYDENGNTIAKGYSPTILPTLRTHIAKLAGYFGQALVSNIGPDELEGFRQHRLETPIAFTYTRGENKGAPILDEHGNPRTRARSVLTVNRELEVLRTMLGFAVELGWIAVNPFRNARARSVIDTAAERKAQRTTVLSLAEEKRLVAAASADGRAHLRPLLLFLLDTGARRNEALSLTWRDVDLDAGIATIRALHTKTRTLRKVPLTKRVLEELQRLLEQTGGPADELVFGKRASVRRAFKTACRLAGLDGLRLHDLRHTAGSRFAARIAISEVADILGHVRLETTKRYLNITEERLKRARLAIEQYHDDEAG